MGTPVKIKNAADAWTNQGVQTRNYNQKAVMWLRSLAGSNRYGWIYFTKPWPNGAIIISAKLRLYNVENLTVSTQVSIQRASAKWRVNRITWDTQPGVTGTIATQTKATSGPGGEWEIDVTELIQSIANGAAWYGFRITTNNTTGFRMHATESSTGKYRPVLVVEWTMPPEEPDELVPRDGLVAFQQKPIVKWTYNDPGGDNVLSAVHVQFGSSEANVEAGTTTYDSGEQATTVPELNLNTVAPAFAGVAAGVENWWRARNKDEAGYWSPWSEAAMWTWQARGVLTMTSPAASPNNFIYRTVPTVTWTFTGQTQKHYQVYVALAGEPDDWLWTTGKITGTTTSVGIPENILTDEGATYRIGIRVWDSLDRTATPGQSLYTEVTRDVTFAYDGSIDSHVINLSAVSDPLYPIVVLTWNRSGAVFPTDFVIQRSEDAGVTWTNLEEATALSLFVSGTQYTYTDRTPSPYTPYVWRVMPVNSTNGRMTSGNPTDSGESRRLAPFLYRPDGTDAVCFINPKRSRRNNDIQDLHEPIGGPPILVTQRIGGKSGAVEGRFVDDILPGVSAKEMYKRFQSMRKDAGTPLYVATANETYKVVAFNFQDEVLTDVSGITYLASFEWVEIP